MSIRERDRERERERERVRERERERESVCVCVCLCLCLCLCVCVRHYVMLEQCCARIVKRRFVTSCKMFDFSVSVPVRTRRNIQHCPSVRRLGSTIKQSSAKWQKIVFVMFLKYTPVTKKHTVLDLFNACSNHEPLKYSGKESRNNLQFMILTYLRP